MNYAKINKNDIANGIGVRVTLFVSGCTHHCKGCFNQEAWDFNHGQPFDKKAEDLFISYAKNPHVTGVCLLGGEVFQQDLDRILDLVIRIKREVRKPIHVWSGYTYEELMADEKKMVILCHIDTLVDGPFIFKQKDLRLKHRGSSNQRVIDVQASMQSGQIVLIED